MKMFSSKEHYCAFSFHDLQVGKVEVLQALLWISAVGRKIIN